MTSFVTADVTPEMADTLRERILSRITVEDRGYTTPCWISNRAAGGGRGDYTKIGITTADGRYVSWYTHRLAYVLFVGPIRADLEIDHRCDQGKCCNPDHLAAVTTRENLLRSTGVASAQRAQRACVAGHPFNEANTYTDRRGRRHCRRCKVRRHAEWRSRRRTKSTDAPGEGAS